jgi:diguanylate cyclase (GGDEF)-like protein/putative nucleotidyltransferase with HDIG domain
MAVSTSIILTLLVLVGALVHFLGRRTINAARRRAQETSDLHLATVEALAHAIDAKDQTAEEHIQRVQAYAVGVAKAIGLPAGEIQGLATAALLHDIGKLAVPEHILSKPGPLTAEEFQKVRSHSQVGADILASVPFPYPVASFIRSHHERWDGHGYPAGLKGEEIPVGARILSIVDYFDAVTMDRPYHKANSYDTGIALLQHEAGKALDPALVATFVDLLPRFNAQAAGVTRGRAESSSGPATAPRTLAPATAAARSVFADIALAHRELYALYEIAQSMGTSLGVSETMALISSKIGNLVPWSTCALFLVDEEPDRLICRYAAGTDSMRIFGRTLDGGMGPSGWVARHRRSLVRDRLQDDDEALPGTTFKSAIVSPLVVQGRFIGTLALYHSEPQRYTADHRRLLEQVAEQAAAVIQNSILFEQTQVDSLTDSLTGLPNRRSMFAHVTRELARADRLQSEVSLIVLDIDDFKVINDTYGHHLGDRALREMAAALRGSLRAYDVCVRYAGDEFVVVLPDQPRESAETKRRALQERIGRIELEVRPGQFVRLAASAGAAVFPHDGLTYEALLADADLRMYRDKAARRSARQLHSAPTTGGDFGAPGAPVGSAPNLAAPFSRAPD